MASDAALKGGGGGGYRRFFLAVLALAASSLAAALLLAGGAWSPHRARPVRLRPRPLDLAALQAAPRAALASLPPRAPRPRDGACTYWSCFDVYRCGAGGRQRLAVYLYPLLHYTHGEGEHEVPISRMSQEFYQVLEAIRRSRYYTPEPTEACLLVPTLDTLNQNRFNAEHVSQALHSMPYWNDGVNHLIFNMLPGSAPDYQTVVELDTGKALIAGAGFDTWTFRPGFDVSIPVFSPEATTIDPKQPSKKTYLIVSAQVNLHIDDVTDLQHIASSNDDLLLLEDCSENAAETNHSIRCQYKTGKMFNFPQILKRGVFCVVARSVRLAQSSLLDALASGCIPIIIADSIVMPFEPFIDWHRVALFIPEENLSNLLKIVNGVSLERRAEMFHQTRWLYDKYFSSMERITLTTLDIINEKVFPLMAKQYEDWNLPEHLYGPTNPLFMPVTAPKSMGFTAVILTYDRVESLFTLIRKLVQTPSLAKVLVIWNNQKKPPPPSSEWPVINKPLKVIQTKENKLSNRFYPYDEIETECQLTIDDDIIMLTPDELEFGFDVWREFPDRIVGFPSRLHMWNNDTNSWKYQSEWTNQISMVLTGAAFHHKIWSWYYTKKLPQEIREFVDEHFNCEDIAMNFLVANITNKAPIKVAPRKKFKCPECTNTEMLSADQGHMTQRSECVDRFAKIFGQMALRSTEFRADPVLYKDTLPDKLKLYSQVGAL